MPRPIPGWLYILIGLAIIIIVGGVVFFSGRASSQTTRGITATATSHPTLTPTFTPTATAQANVIAPTPTAVAGDKTIFLIFMEKNKRPANQNSPPSPHNNHTIFAMASYAQQY